jgi:hypothetical protein
MLSPDQEHKSDTSSLDAERARLRSAGYTDAEISQILIARASQQPAATGQGVMSNVLSSILGVASHARALIPTFRKDVETVFDGAATASARAGAVASLAVKATVVIVLGYAAYQEWKQHIIYAPQIAAHQTDQTKAEACNAITKAAGETLRGDRTPETTARVKAEIDAVCGWNPTPATSQAAAPSAAQLALNARVEESDHQFWARFQAFAWRLEAWLIGIFALFMGAAWLRSKGWLGGKRYPD